MINCQDNLDICYMALAISNWLHCKIIRKILQKIINLSVETDRQNQFHLVSYYQMHKIEGGNGRYYFPIFIEFPTV